MAGKGWKHGKALSDDKKTIRYFSPSALMVADPGTSEGCLRKYWFEYRAGKKPEQTSWQAAGIELHAQNEHYLLTGEKNMGSLALAGLHMLPKPFTIDPRIMIEHEIAGDLATAPLRAAGIPVAGYIDCIHWQETNPGSMDITDTIDPPGTISVLDWKTSSSTKWLKTPQEVSRTLQMTIYGKWALVTRPDKKHVRLGHGYYITKGKETPRMVSLRVHRDQIDERWEYVEGLASSLKEVVKEDNPDNVPANTRACGAFRGCPHRSYCTAAQHNSLSSLLGADFASSLLGLPTDSVLSIPTTEELTKDPSMSISLLSKLQAAQPVPPAQNIAVQLEMKRLELEEFSIKYPGLPEIINELETLGMGMPNLTDEAARAYTAIKGSPVVPSGELAQFSFSQAAELPAILTEAKTIVAMRTAGTDVVVEVAAPVVETVVSPFPADAPPALASPPEKEKKVEIVSAADAIEAAASDKKGGKKKGKKAEPVAEATEAPVITANMVVTTYMTDTAINLYIDCIPSCKYESFWPYVTKVTDALVAQYGADYKTPLDDKAPTAYGKWKAFLSAGLRHVVATMPPGNYLLDGATEIGGVVIDAMRDIVTKSGGLLVRGIR